MKIKLSHLILLLPLALFLGFKGDDKNQRKTNTKDHYTYININNVLMWVSNNGDGSHSPLTDGNGYYWPDKFKSAIFEDGLVWGAKIDNKIIFNGNTHRQGLQAGKIIDGQPDDPSLDKYRVYRIRRNWESLLPGPEKDAFKKDYEEWPIEDGAPYIDINGDGIPTPGTDLPEFIGDETLWFVSNDMDSVRTKFTYGSMPAGLEIQTTVYGYKTSNLIGDAVFKKYKIINKGDNNLEEMFLGYWSDPDLGDANDDFTGCDTTLELGYCFNAVNSDGIYGSPPPAVGYTLLQGPVVPGDLSDSAQFLGGFRKGIKNLPMTSFVFYLGGSSVYRDPSQGNYSGSLEFYNYLQGNLWNGDSFIDPNTGNPVKYLLAGDPVTGTGWYESVGPGSGWPGGPPPGDRRFLLSAGPFNLAPGDTQEIVLAIHMAKGLDNINSITALKNHSSLLKNLYSTDPLPLPESPRLYTVAEDRKVQLWWEPNSEDYSITNIFLPDTVRYELAGVEYKVPVKDTTYDFQAYRIWQFKDEDGTDPRLLATYDIQDGIAGVYNYPFEAIRENGLPVPFEPFIIFPELYLKRFYTITRDAYTGSSLYSGSEYYFAVTSCAYNKYSDPPVLESKPQIVKIIPGHKPIDAIVPYKTGDRIKLNQTAGRGDAIVELLVVDPYKVKGHNYRVEINGELNTTAIKDTGYSYNFINLSENDTLKFQEKDFLYSEYFNLYSDTFAIPEASLSNKKILDGLILYVHQQGADSIEAVDYSRGGRISAVKGIYEITGPEGTPLPEPLPVFRELNSTGDWQIDVDFILYEPVQSLSPNGDAIGYNDFEIRFTDSSQYYIFPSRINFNNSPKAEGMLPFQVWNMGNNSSEPQRLYIKTLDLDSSGDWSFNNKLGGWEPVYVFKTDAPYIENIPVPAPSVPAPYRLFGNLVFKGEVPAEGTILRLETWQPLSHGDIFEIKLTEPRLGDNAAGRQNLDKISVFPNPYYAAASSANNPAYVRFTNLPLRAIIRIYSLGGVYINRLEKDGEGQYIDWDLRNKDGLTVGSGIYLVYIEMPGIGTKIMKLGVVN